MQDVKASTVLRRLRSEIRRLDKGRGDGNGGRIWWLHFAFIRINIEPTILRKKIEDLRQLGAFRFTQRAPARSNRGGLVNPTVYRDKPLSS